jgi:hypothetical protein
MPLLAKVVVAAPFDPDDAVLVSAPPPLPPHAASNAAETSAPKSPA